MCPATCLLKNILSNKIEQTISDRSGSLHWNENDIQIERIRKKPMLKIWAKI